MSATYTTRIEYLPVVELEKAAAWIREAPAAGKAALMLVSAPVLGLALVIGLPILSVGLTAWFAAKALAPKLAGAAAIAKRTALFAAAPFIGLAYLLAFPFVGLGALVYYGVKAARK